VNSAPQANRTTGPKLGADRAPTKKSPGTLDSSQVLRIGVSSTVAIFDRSLSPRKGRRESADL
jgi:hypothetical protein